MPVLKEEENRVLVTCAFCRGKGVDPFGIMSQGSTCYACYGEKAIWVEKPVRGCIFCGGTGVSPTGGGRNYCIVCGGAGVVHVEEPSQVCPNCGGTGWGPTISLYCNVCKGTGLVPVKTAKDKQRLQRQKQSLRQKVEKLQAQIDQIDKIAEEAPVEKAAEA